MTQQEYNDKKKVIELEIEKLFKILDETKRKESILKENQYLFENLLKLKASRLISENEYIQKEQLLLSSLQEKQNIDYGSLKDIDENCYKTVQIGDQTWMTENLNVSRFRNGDLIKEAQSIEEWSYCAENKIPAWCYYQNNSEFAKKYGKLYNWYAAADSRGIAPIGWRVALIEDWGNFKENIDSTKKYLIPNGKRWYDEGFVEIDSWGWYWTPVEWQIDKKFGLEMYYTNDDISTTGQWHKETGMAIRCVKE